DIPPPQAGPGGTVGPAHPETPSNLPDGLPRPPAPWERAAVLPPTLLGPGETPAPGGTDPPGAKPGPGSPPPRCGTDGPQPAGGRRRTKAAGKPAGSRTDSGTPRGASTPDRGFGPACRGTNRPEPKNTAGSPRRREPAPTPSGQTSPTHEPEPTPPPGKPGPPP